ncbi:MAG TPA: molybdenum cofactor guanylyltransferase [Chloroflexota bacterium]|nr:molybdenum cofactor guanylyltransferase [Chloroflexota bacterium]
MNPAVSGIVLAGGRSRRLGVDKRTLTLRSVQTQLAKTLERLSAVADDIVVAGDPSESVADHARVVRDVAVGAGPLAGIVAGLTAVRHDHAIVLACDLPFLNVELLRQLIALPRNYALLVPGHSDGTLEMLHAVYAKSTVTILQWCLSNGQRRLSDLPEVLKGKGLVVQIVDDGWLRLYDPSLRSFFNLNTPEDLRRAVEDLRSEHV